MIQDPAKYSETDESKADPMRSMAGIIDKLKLDSQRDILNGFLRTGGALNPGVGGNYPFDNAATDPLYAPEQPKSGWGETFDALRHRESFAYGLLHRGDRILQRLTGDFKTDPNFNSLDWMAKNYGQIQDIPEHIWARFGAGEYNDARSEEELFWLLSLDMQYDEWKRIIGNASLPTQLTAGLGAAALDPTTYIIPMAGAVNRSIRAGRAAQSALEMGATAKLAAEIGKDAGKAGMLARLSTTPVLSGFATASTNEAMLQLLDRDQRDADESVVNLLMNTAFDTAVHAGVRLYGKGKNAFVDWLNEDGGRLETPIDKEAIRAVTESNGGVVDVPETTADANVATEALRREGVAQTAVEGEVIDAPDVAARQTFDPQQVAKSVEPEQTPQVKPTADTESQSSQTVREQPANELAPTRETVATQESSPIVGTQDGKQPWEMTPKEHAAHVSQREGFDPQNIDGYSIDGMPVVKKGSKDSRTVSGTRGTLKDGFANGSKVNVKLFDGYNAANPDRPMKLPEGYVREGDFYVPKASRSDSASPKSTGPAAKQPWEMTREEFTETATDKTSREDYAKAWTPIKSPRGTPNTIEFVPYTGSTTDGVLRWNDPEGIGRGILSIESGKIQDVAVEKAWRRKGIASELYNEAEKRGVTEPKGTITTSAVLVRHKRAVKRALAEGKPVPAEVLADYPDLAAQYAPASAPEAVEPARTGPKPAPPKPATAKEPWEMTREEYVGEYREPYSVKDIQEASKKAKGQRKKFNARTGAMVPPSISKEIADKISKNESTAEGMREAYRTYIAAYQRGVEDHYRYVERAIREGKPVPPAVLADYPDLAGKLQTAAKPMEVDDLVVMHSPHTGEDSIVNYRGRIGDQAVVVTASGYQMQVPVEWLRSQGEPFAPQPTTGASTVSSASTKKNVSAMNKAELIDELLPEQSGGPVDVSSRRSIERADLRKKPLEQLRKRVQDNRNAEDRRLQTRPIADAEYKRLLDVAKSAGGQWKSALIKEAESAGVSMPPITTQSETAGILANKIADRRIDYPDLKPAAPAESGGAVLKEPWQKTKREFVSERPTDPSRIDFNKTHDEVARTVERHKKFVEDALAEGKLVPPEVLADYPELVKSKDGISAGESAARARIEKRNVARAQARKGGKRLGSAPIFEDAIDHAIIAAHIVARSGKRAISDIVAAVQEAIKNRPDLQEHIDRMVEAVKRIIDTAYEKGTFSAQDYTRASDMERRAAKIGLEEPVVKVDPKDYEPVQPKDVTGKDIPNYTSASRAVSSKLNEKGVPTPTPATRLMYSPATSVRAAANILFPSMRLEGQESGRVFRGQKAAAVVADAQRFKIKIAAQVEEAKNAIIGKNLGSLQAYFRRGQLRWFNQNRFNLGLTNLTDQTIAEAGLAVAIRRNATPNRPIGQIHAEVRQLMMTRVTDRLAKDGELHKVGISDKNFRPDTIVDEAMKSASQIVSSNFNLPTMALALTTKIDASDPKMTRLIGLLEALGRKDDVAKLQEMVGKVEKGEENATTLDNLRNQIINEVNRKRLSMRELTTGIREQMLEVDEYGNLKYPEAASISDESIMHAVYSLMEPDLAGEPDPKAMALLADMGIDGMDFARHARASITKSVNISQDARIVRKWLDSVSRLYTEMGWDKARLIDDEGNFKTPEELLSVLQEDMVAHLGDDGLKRETPEYSRAVGDIVDVITSSKIILGLTRIDSSSLDVALAGLQQLSSAFYLAGSVGSVSQEAGATMSLVGPQKYAESLFNVRIAPVARELAKLDAADPELGAFARETLTKFGLGLEERHVALKRMVERTDLPMEEAPSGIPARLGAAYVASTRRIYEIAGEGDVPLINLIPVLNKAIKATSLGGAAQHNLKAAVSSWSQLVWGWMPELAKIERFRAEGLSVKEAIAKAGSKMPAWMADDLINYLDKSDLGYMAGLHDKAEAIRAKYAPDDPMRAKELHNLGVVEIAGTILPGEIPGRPAHNKVVNDFASATLQMVKLAAPQPGIGEKPLAAQTSRYFSLVWQFLTIPNAMISTGAVSKAGMMDLHQQAGLFATLLGAGALDMASRYWIRDGLQQGTANLEKDWNNDPAMIVSNVIGRAGIVGLWDKLTSPALAFLAGSSYEVKDRVSRALTPPVVTYLSTLTAGIQSLLHIGSEKGLTPAQERDLRRLTVVRNMVWSQAISSIIAGEYTTAKGGSVPVRSRPTYRVSGNKLISPQRQRQLALEAYDTDNLNRAGSAPAKR